MTEGTGRSAQKERTRKALLDGARALIQEGRAVTVAAAAERHGISKATAYRYFSDPALMVAEAGLDISVAPYEEVVAGAPDLRAQLRAISLYFFDIAICHEIAFRQFVGMTLVASASDGGKVTTRRAGRRIAMYRRALSGDDGGLSDAVQTHLVQALAASTGAEAMIALLDVVGTDAASAREIVCDITDAILDRHLGKPACP